VLDPRAISSPINVYRVIGRAEAGCCELSEPVGTVNGGDRVEVLDMQDPKDPMYYKIWASSGVEGWIDPPAYPFSGLPGECE